ncbi:uncharacterized protein LOC119193790 [Manduca sexta]|uniref:uncharacterized protein LOC119193790 n=1 Tax=Manduca sexta TaxID=7130 RepID=UPI00188EE1C4|nr:uncharacterized protein LOC119193790 [Manduca sexta]
MFRKELGQLIEIDRGVNSHRMLKIKDKLYRKYKVQNENDHANTAEILKQKIKALAGRIKRYEEINAKKDQNKLFNENQHKFYKSLENNSYRVSQIPSKDSIEQYWTDILSNPKQYNKDARWIEEIDDLSQRVETTETDEITVDEVKLAIRKLHNWKTPGIDKLQNYYLKYFSNSHKYLATIFTKIVQGKQNLEEWFTTGNILHNHCSNNDIMAIEQRGCRRGAKGCKDHLMVNKAILEDAHQMQKNLSMAWIDYQKPLTVSRTNGFSRSLIYTDAH